jgi:hypothetical protein
MPLSVEERRQRNRLAVRRTRARETPDARADRLRRDRERHRRASELTAAELQNRATPHSVRVLPTSTSTVTVQETDDGRNVEVDRAWGVGDEIPRLHPNSEACKRDCLHRLQLTLGAVGLDEVTCAVCDRSQLRKECHVIEVSDASRIQQLRQVLTSDGETLPAALAGQYDSSGLSSTFGRSTVVEAWRASRR